MNARPELSGKTLLLFALGAIAASGSVHAQRGGPPAGPPPTPKLVAPIDVTGQWVSIISEDWRYRIATPPKGDYTGVPLNGAARRVADAWDPARDEAVGDQCKAYGVGGVMRLPTRVRISWIDDQTLKIETDAGTQTRTIGFGVPTSPGGDWQGSSVATWDRSAAVIGGLFSGPGPGGTAGRGGSLKVVTTKMKSGYLRRNGVPYSADAVVTEYFDRFDVPNGDSLLVVSTEIVDPAYLAQPYWTSTHFRKQADRAGWSPTPCVAR
jgi:hypothetical protein